MSVDECPIDCDSCAKWPCPELRSFSVSIQGAATGNVITIPGDPENKFIVPLITNEMKAQCINEFSFEIQQTCPFCYNDGADPSCKVCGGNVGYMMTIAVPWDLCKKIYRKMVQAAMHGMPSE